MTVVIVSVIVVSGQVTTATVDLYNSIRVNMKPTPKKSHYTFNLRDVSKVFQVRIALSTRAFRPCFFPPSRAWSWHAAVRCN